MVWKFPVFQYHYKIMVIKVWDFPGGWVLKNPPANAGVWSLIQEDSTSVQSPSQSDSLWLLGLQHARLPCPSLAPRAYSNSCPLCQWCHLTISSSVVPFSSHLNLSQHQGLFQCVGSLHQVAKVLEFQLQLWSCQWIFRTEFLWHWLVGSPCSPRESQESSSTPPFKSISSLAFSFPYCPTFTSIHDYWKIYSFD